MKLEFSFSYQAETRTTRNDSFRLEVEQEWNASLNILAGPSGAGKTSFLNLLAGLLIPQSGFLQLNERCLFDPQQNISVATRNRRIAYVFQDNLLFPHMNVRKNIGYSQNTGSKEWSQLEGLNLAPLMDRYPRDLSGGEQRRVAIARALMSNPELILLDEPFNGLNESLRIALLETLLDYQKRKHVGLIIVTHDHQQLFAQCQHQTHYMENGTLRTR